MRDRVANKLRLLSGSPAVPPPSPPNAQPATPPALPDPLPGSVIDAPVGSHERSTRHSSALALQRPRRPASSLSSLALRTVALSRSAPDTRWSSHSTAATVARVRQESAG